jgi:FeS assembly SUF system protein
MNKIVHFEPTPNMRENLAADIADCVANKTENDSAGMGNTDTVSLKEKIINAVKTVYDPEIPVNIYDLGLIYDIETDADNNVHINMTLTAPACPVADILPGQVAAVVKNLDEVNDVKVDLVFDPPWTKERMSEEAMLLLDML